MVTKGTYLRIIEVWKASMKALVAVLTLHVEKDNSHSKIFNTVNDAGVVGFMQIVEGK